MIGAAIEVHRLLGPGFLESVYENALVLELRKRGLKAEQQKEILIRYDAVEVGKHRLDLFVEDEIVVDLMVKACGISYLEAAPEIQIFMIDDVPIPFASAKLLLRTKQTYREKDAEDRMFLEQKIAQMSR